MPSAWRRRTILGTALAAGGLAAASVRAEDARYVKIATGSVTGTYYPVGSLIADLLSRPPGARACREAGGCGVPNLILVVEASKGSVANVEAIAAGRVETGFAQSDVAYGAFSGTGVFAGQPPKPGLRALASLYLESVHLLVTRDSGIATVADLRGRRVSLDVEGSGTLVDALLILEAFGLAPGDLQVTHATPAPLDRPDGRGRARRDVHGAGYPAAIVTEAVQTQGARLVPITGEAVGRLLARHRFLTLADIPGDTYPGIEAGTPTLGVAALWVVAATLDETLVYEIIRALWHPDTLAKLAAGHPKGAEILLANALRGVSIPLHPGAARFYREQGWPSESCRRGAAARDRGRGPGQELWAPWSRWPTSASPSAGAAPWRCSAPTVPARPRPSPCCWACSSPVPARSASWARRCRAIGRVSCRG